jgi:hypothetical protein
MDLTPESHRPADTPVSSIINPVGIVIEDHDLEYPMLSLFVGDPDVVYFFRDISAIPLMVGATQTKKNPFATQRVEAIMEPRPEDPDIYITVSPRVFADDKSDGMATA